MVEAVKSELVSGKISPIPWHLQGIISNLQGIVVRSPEIYASYQPVTGKFPKADNRELDRPIRELSGKSEICNQPNRQQGQTVHPKPKFPVKRSEPRSPVLRSVGDRPLAATGSQIHTITGNKSEDITQTPTLLRFAITPGFLRRIGFSEGTPGGRRSLRTSAS